ncbi:Multidrug efflux pump subunit AcrA (membrane-fusion protein) [Brevibacterium sp. 239c]|uniref:hypothetical protein n=1 Tax=Brevibacterium sp. 239c TaxID=1965356 RepID=UPI000C65048F|nr:hypothetical protein [Brevibacterium sp. 239c]SMX77924.1 Multidrug efflux pump subunit AcrA (membrane-fusion protein) [Brevibacterium sp. 239c]
MHIFRRVILPLAFLLVFVVIAALLGWIAFKPDADDGFDGVEATGESAGSIITAERGDISNSIEAKGAINVDEPTAVKAAHEGKVNHFFAQPGDEVFEGAELFQVRSEEADEEQPPASSDSDSDTDAPEDSQYDEGQEPAKPKYHTVTAEADGTVGDFAVEKNDQVSSDTQVTELLKNTFTARAPIEAVDLYRIPKLPRTANITIADGPEPFDCENLRLDQGAGTGAASKAGGEDAADDGESGEPPAEEPAADEDPEAGSGTGPQLICKVPKDVTVYNSLDLTMTVEAGAVSDVIIAPVTAVRGLTGTGTVWVTGDDGEPEERSVRLGLNDGSMVEVKSGLKEGEEIEEFVPGTEPEDDEMDEDMYGEMDGEFEDTSDIEGGEQ